MEKCSVIEQWIGHCRNWEHDSPEGESYISHWYEIIIIKLCKHYKTDVMTITFLFLVINNANRTEWSAI
jgi:hypothetical protein